jgi:hypothetical protein
MLVAGRCAAVVGVEGLLLSSSSWSDEGGLSHMVDPVKRFLRIPVRKLLAGLFLSMSCSGISRDSERPLSKNHSQHDLLEHKNMVRW